VRAPFQMNYGVQPPINFLPPGKLGEPTGPVQLSNPAAMPNLVNVWNSNANGVSFATNSAASSKGIPASLPDVAGHQQPISNFGRPPVPSSFQGPPMASGGGVGHVPHVASQPPVPGPWLQVSLNFTALTSSP